MATKKIEINCTTNEVIEREMTKDELIAEKELQQKIINEIPAVDQARAAAKVELLNRLGITAEEAKLLLL